MVQAGVFVFMRCNDTTLHAPLFASTRLLPLPFLNTHTHTYSKRTFTSVTGHSLPASTSHSKASKEHSASKPGSGGKQQAAGGQKGSMLVPPQLRGR